jgi:D-amino-acid dehydrogenase
MSRVVILGAGVIGLSCALACRRRGHEVTIVERKPWRRDGCSFGNAGMIVPSHFVPLAAPGMVALGFKWMWNPESPFFIKPRLDAGLMDWGWKFMRAATKRHVDRCAPLIRDLSLASRKLFTDWQESGRDLGLVTDGLIMLCRSEHGLGEEAAAAAKAKELGIPAQVLDGKGLAALEPGVSMSAVGGVLYPKDAHLSPEKFIASLEAALLEEGSEFIWEAEALGWRKESSKLAALKTSRGEIAGDAFLLAAGSWSDTMLDGLDLRLPMQAGKGYSLTVPDPVQLPRKCAIFTEARVAVTPMNGQLRFGGTMEIAGRDESITRRRVHGIIRAAGQYYPAFEESHFEGIEPWHGLRPCSPDGMPYLGRTKAASNLIVATGHAMMGLSLAPITGQLVGAIVDGEATGIDISLLDPDRYA